MIITMKRADVLQVIDEFGIDRFITFLENQYKLGLYKASTNWIDDEQFGIKLKGSKGDMLIKLENDVAIQTNELECVEE